MEDVKAICMMFAYFAIGVFIAGFSRTGSYDDEDWAIVVGIFWPVMLFLVWLILAFRFIFRPIYYAPDHIKRWFSSIKNKKKK